MAIGDAFTANDLDAAEWAEFCAATGLAPAFVSKEIKTLSERIHNALAQTAPAVMDAGADPAIVQAITTHALQESRRLLEMSKNIGYMFRHR